MSAGFAIAMQAVPFFQLLDREVAAVAALASRAGAAGRCGHGRRPAKAFAGR